MRTLFKMKRFILYSCSLKPSHTSHFPSYKGNKYCILLCDPGQRKHGEGKFEDKVCGAKASCKPVSGKGVCTYNDGPLQGGSDGDEERDDAAFRRFRDFEVAYGKQYRTVEERAMRLNVFAGEKYIVLPPPPSSAVLLFLHPSSSFILILLVLYLLLAKKVLHTTKHDILHTET